MIERMAKQWLKEWTGGGALTKEAAERQAHWWVNKTADELWRNGNYEAARLLRSEINCNRNVTYADTERHEGLKVVFPKGPCKLEKGHKGTHSFYGVRIR